MLSSLGHFWTTLLIISRAAPTHPHRFEHRGTVLRWSIGLVDQHACVVEAAFAVGSLHLLRSVGGPRVVAAVVDHDTRTLLGKAHRNGLADTGGRSSHKGVLSNESLLHEWERLPGRYCRIPLIVPWPPPAPEGVA